MNYLLEVCLVALTLANSIKPSIVTPPVASASEAASVGGADTSPALQKGISVQMPVTRNAQPLPDADRENPAVVAVTRDGRIYLGVDLTTPSNLAAKVKAGLSNEPASRLYIKADSRASYANVEKVLDAASAAGVQSVSLLTSQSIPSQPGTFLPPNGLEVLVSPRAHFGLDVAIVNLFRSAQQSPKLTINGQQVPWPSLQTALTTLLQNQEKRVVLLGAEGELPFSAVVNVADACRSINAEVVLLRP